MHPKPYGLVNSILEYRIICNCCRIVSLLCRKWQKTAAKTAIRLRVFAGIIFIRQVQAECIGFLEYIYYIDNRSQAVEVYSSWEMGEEASASKSNKEFRAEELAGSDTKKCEIRTSCRAKTQVS